MSCPDTLRVHVYYDGALPLVDARMVEMHIKSCADCRAVLDDLREISNSVSNASMAPMPLAVSQRLENAWSSARDRGVMRIAGWMTAAAAAILIGALSIWPREGSDVASPWQTAAVMPPIDSRDEAAPEIVAAQWIANDLSLTEAVNR